jgi:hypothetical protein
MQLQIASLQISGGRVVALLHVVTATLVLQGALPRRQGGCQGRQQAWSPGRQKRWRGGALEQRPRTADGGDVWLTEAEARASEKRHCGGAPSRRSDSRSSVSRHSSGAGAAVELVDQRKPAEQRRCGAEQEAPASS